MYTAYYDSRKEREVWRVVPDLIRARQLLIDLVWKDLRVRYRYAAMGFLWAIMEPLAFTLILTFVFTFVFGQRAALANADTGPPYAVMLLCGLIFWQYFSVSLSTATVSVVANKNLVKKVRFAREIIPIAACGMPLVQLSIGAVLLLITHILFGGRVGLSVFWIPLIFGIQLVMTVGLALLFSCGHVHFRDIGNLVNILLLFGFYASPVFYPLELVQQANIPSVIRYGYLLNPMAGILTAYRHALFEHRMPELHLVLWPAICAAASLLLGIVIFRRLAATMSDYL